MTNTKKSNKDGQQAKADSQPGATAQGLSIPVLGKDIAFPGAYDLLRAPAKEAFKEGFSAFYQGVLLSSCPYLLKNLVKASQDSTRVAPLAKKGLPLIGSWQEGWRFAKELNDSRRFVRQGAPKTQRSPSLTVRLRADQESLLRQYALVEVRSLNTMTLAMIKWFFKKVTVKGQVSRAPRAPKKSDTDKMMLGLQLRPTPAMRNLIIESAAQARNKFPNINAYIIAIIDEYIRAHPLDSGE